MAKLRRMRPALGTYVEIGMGDSATMGSAMSAIEIAFTAIEQVDMLLSFHAPESELTQLNQQPLQRVKLDPVSLRVLRLARATTRASGGAFNCTVGGALVRRGALPNHGGAEVIDIGNHDDIEIGNDWARLRRPVRITLDGIAKGYAVDAAVAALQRNGISAGWVNAGGDLRVFGDMALPVHRRELDGGFTSLGALRQGALASSRGASAPDERHTSAMVGGIIDNPGQTVAQGVWSVLANTAWRADALTKVACFTAPRQRAAAVARLGGHLVPRVPLVSSLAPSFATSVI
jgi:FAD:protein FMN transferase